MSEMRVLRELVVRYKLFKHQYTVALSASEELCT